MGNKTTTGQVLMRTSLTRNMRDSQIVVPVVLIIVLLFTLAASSAYCVWVFLQRTERLYRGYIYPHVFALGIDLGGMTPQEAEAALLPVSEYVSPGKVTLTNGEQKWTYDWFEAGA